jgi:hypothetical protein
MHISIKESEHLQRFLKIFAHDSNSALKRIVCMNYHITFLKSYSLWLLLKEV